MLRATLVGATAAATGYVLYRTYSEFIMNEVLISIREYVPLTGSDTQSFTDLSSTVEGEIRIDCNTTSAYKFLLKLNAAFLEAGSFNAGRNRATSANSSHYNGGSRDGTNSANDLVPLGQVEMNEIVDTWSLHNKQQLIFSPACVSNQTLLRYRTRLHESFAAPVSARDCIASSTGPGVLQLGFSLMVHAAVLDLEVVIALPKRTRVLSVDHSGVGSWRPSASSGREIVWHIGACGTGNTSSRTETASLATVRTHVQEKQRNVFGKNGNGTGNGNAQKESPARMLPDETVVISNLDEYPQADLGDFMERIHFEMQYALCDSHEEEEEETTGGKKRKASSKSKRQQHNRENENDDFVDLGAPPAPGVNLSYAIATTASGLTVRRLQTLEESKNWSVDTASPVWKVARILLPAIDNAKLCKKAQYTTRLSQTLAVEVQY